LASGYLETKIAYIKENSASFSP